MFDVKKECNFSIEQKLLYDILQELKNIKGVLADEKRIWKESEGKSDETREINETTEVFSGKEKVKYTCKACGNVYDDWSSMMACAKKCKKEGANELRKKRSRSK